MKGATLGKGNNVRFGAVASRRWPAGEGQQRVEPRRSANGGFGEAPGRSAIGARGRLVRSDIRLPDEAREGPAGVEGDVPAPVAGDRIARQELNRIGVHS